MFKFFLGLSAPTLLINEFDEFSDPIEPTLALKSPHNKSINGVSQPRQGTSTPYNSHFHSNVLTNRRNSISGANSTPMTKGENAFSGVLSTNLDNNEIEGGNFQQAIEKIELLESHNKVSIWEDTPAHK